MTDVDDTERADYDDTNAREQEPAATLDAPTTNSALGDEELNYEATSADTVLNDGQSRCVLQAERLDKSNLRNSLLKPYGFFAHLNVQNNGEGPLKPIDVGDYYQEPEILEQQNVVGVEVIRGAVSFCKYPPAVKMPLTLRDFCRVFDNVIMTGAPPTTRAQWNLTRSIVFYPGRCLNEDAPIETDLTEPLPALGKSSADTPGQLAIVGWQTKQDDTNAISPLVIQPSSYVFAAVRRLHVPVAALVQHLRSTATAIDARVNALEVKRASAPKSETIPIDIAAAKAARDALKARADSIVERRFRFLDNSGVPNGTVPDSVHDQRRIVVYAYDIVPDLVPPPVDLLRPVIPGFEKERDNFARRLWAPTAVAKPFEAIGLRLEVRGTEDGKYPRFTTLFLLPQLPISPTLSDVKEVVRNTNVPKLAAAAPPVGTAASDLIVVQESYDATLKALNEQVSGAAAAQKSKPTPTVVVPAPTKDKEKETMVDISAKSTGAMIAHLTAVADDVATKPIDDQLAAAGQKKRKTTAQANGDESTPVAPAKRPKPSASEVSGDDETAAAVVGSKRKAAVETSVKTTGDAPSESEKPAAAKRKRESAPTAEPSSDLMPLDAAPPPPANATAKASKTMHIDEMGVLRIVGDAKPANDMKLRSYHARVNARLQSTFKKLESDPQGHGAISRVDASTDRLDSAQREQLAAFVQVAQYFGCAEEVMAVVANHANAFPPDDDNDADGTEAARLAAAAAEAERKAAEEEKKRKAAEEAEKKRKAAEEAEKKRKAAEEAEKKRKAAEEAEKKRKAAEEAEKKRKADEAAKQAAEQKKKPAAVAKPADDDNNDDASNSF